MLDGVLERMIARPGDPAHYDLVLESLSARSGAAADSGHYLDLNSCLNKWLRIEFNGCITCSACHTQTRRSYGEGYCYRCFRSLARCDLCVVSPVRCHYAQGTCREPEWGEAFCMQPHLVYLANSSGPKVGITTDGGQVARWLDQGATQGLVVARAVSRHLAGVLEDRLAQRISDRTDWRALLRRDAAPVDLIALRRTVAAFARDLPEGVRWLADEAVVAMEYPVLGYPRSLCRFRLEDEGVVSGRLIGIKGQYLLFEHGVLNVRRHRRFHLQVTVTDEPAPGDSGAGGGARQPQMELFSR